MKSTVIRTIEIVVGTIIVSLSIYLLTIPFDKVLAAILFTLVNGYVIYWASYMKTKGKNIATKEDVQEITRLTQSVKNDLDAKFKLMFINEEIRNSVTTHISIRAIDIKLDIWMETYQLYFDYQKTWSWESTDYDKNISDFDKKFQANREKIFLNSVLLGGFLTTKLVRLNNTIRHLIRKEYSNKKYTYQTITQPVDTKDENDDLIKLIPEIEKWFIETEKTDNNLSKIDFNDQQIAELDKLKNEKFDDINAVK